MKYRRGVVVGKFHPPHRGHQLLIETALEQCESVTVFVSARPVDTIPADMRRAWLQEMHPAATVIVLDDPDDERDVAVWAANTMQLLGAAPDAVFTSENYGDAYARAMKCAHVLVDRERVRIPCSSTLIRRDPFAAWDYLPPPVRAWYALRVCVLGAASTGTTTLAEALSRHYETMRVSEYGREYSAAKQARGDDRWTSEEFVHIDRDRSVREATARAGCDLYLLTGDEIPFVHDGLRDSEPIRHEMHLWFEEALREQKAPWLLLRGSLETRLGDATRAIDELLRPR
jgi:HTH-type transcriptional repressor of NAD biosynthesis genes